MRWPSRPLFCCLLLSLPMAFGWLGCPVAPAPEQPAVLGADLLDTAAMRLQWSSPAQPGVVLRLQGSPAGALPPSPARGHLDLVWQGRTVLGQLPGATASAFNVLRVAGGEGVQTAAVEAPIVVQQVGEVGLAARINLSRTFPQLAAWQRDVVWRVGELRVVDEVALHLGDRRALVFAWHVATVGAPTIGQQSGRTWVYWDSGAMELNADRGLTVSFERAGGGLYTLLVGIDPRAPGVRLQTRVLPRAP